MSASITPFALLLQLPLDALLIEFLSDRGLALSLDTIADADDTVVASRLEEAIESAPEKVRGSIQADLRRIALLADARGMDYMLSAGQDRPEVVDGLSERVTVAQRALWLYRHHRAAFDEAEDMFWFDSMPRPMAQQRDLGVKLPVDRTEDARDQLARSLSQFLMRREHCGQCCQVFVMDRSAEKSVQVTVYLQDHACHRAEFVSGQLRRCPSTPARHMALVYSPETGMARTVTRGGTDYHQALVERFAQCLLHAPAGTHRIQPVKLRLEPLRRPLSLPQDILLNGIRVRHLTLVDATTGGEIRINASARESRPDVLELLGQWMPIDNPLRQERFRVAAGEIGFVLLPDQGQREARSATLKMQRNGGTNLEQFDARTRVKLESWLVTWGLLPSANSSAFNGPAAVA